MILDWFFESVLLIELQMSLSEEKLEDKIAVKIKKIKQKSNILVNLVIFKLYLHVTLNVEISMSSPTPPFEGQSVNTIILIVYKPLSALNGT